MNIQKRAVAITSIVFPKNKGRFTWFTGRILCWQSTIDHITNKELNKLTLNKRILP